MANHLRPHPNRALIRVGAAVWATAPRRWNFATGDPAGVRITLTHSIRVL